MSNKSCKMKNGTIILEKELFGGKKSYGCINIFKKQDKKILN